MAKQVFTFGYEGLSLETFLARLKAVGIKTVVDVRANPLSRKRGFSKRGLALALEAEGIVYIHVPAMGCPKPVRDRYKLDGNWSVYTRAFLTYLKGQADSLSALARTVVASPSCLICFEADFNQCHRTFVARALAPILGIGVTHITDQKMIPDAQAQSAA